MNSNTLNKNKQNKINDLPLNTYWTLGYVENLKNRTWKPKNVCTFCTIMEFWHVMKLTIDDPNFPKNIIPPELWIFRKEYIPTWQSAATYANTNQIADISFSGISRKSILHICLLCIGETIPRSDDVLGIRIKFDRGIQVRIWVTSNESAQIIKSFILRKLSYFNKNLVASIKMFDCKK